MAAPIPKKTVATPTPPVSKGVSKAKRPSSSKKIVAATVSKPSVPVYRPSIIDAKSEERDEEHSCTSTDSKVCFTFKKTTTSATTDRKCSSSDSDSVFEPPPVRPPPVIDNAAPPIRDETPAAEVE